MCKEAKSGHSRKKIFSVIISGFRVRYTVRVWRGERFKNPVWWGARDLTEWKEQNIIDPQFCPYIKKEILQKNDNLEGFLVYKMYP